MIRRMILIALTIAATTSAAAAASKSKKHKALPEGTKLSTDMHFDELNVHGKYQAGDEGYATVEDDKQLNDLLDYRKDYKDRLSKSRFQR